MADLVEGDVGFVKPAEQLKYPAVTSCLTVTCVAKDGGKWGAHMSIFPFEKGRPYKTILLDLRTEMSTGKAFGKVEKVLVVGAFGCWQPNLKPVSGLGQQTLAQGGKGETSKILKQTLGLHQLDSTKIGTNPGDSEDFVFVESDVGDIIISRGVSAAEIKPIQFKVQ